MDLGFSTNLTSNNISFGATRKRKKCTDQKSYTQLELSNRSAVIDRVVRKGRRRQSEISKFAKSEPP